MPLMPCPDVQPLAMRAPNTSRNPPMNDCRPLTSLDTSYSASSLLVAYAKNDPRAADATYNTCHDNAEQTNVDGERNGATQTAINQNDFTGKR